MPELKTHFIYMILIYALFNFNHAAAEEPILAPELISGTTRVSAEGLIELAEKTPGLLIIDARIRSDRLQGYIESSISLPDVETDCDSLAKIIPEKNTPVLFYCNGVKCGRSVNSSKIAIACGYKNLYWFRGGFEEWQEKKFPFIKS